MASKNSREPNLGKCVSGASEPASDQEAIWDYYQNEGSDSFEGAQTRLKFLARQICQGGGEVLNIGIGNGLLEAEAQRCGLTVYALDPSERAVLSIRERLHLDARAQVGYSQKIPFADSQFNAVVASEVLEHLDDETLQKSLLEIRRVLKTNGLLLGTVPAREPLAQQIVVCPGCGSRFHRWGHHQSFTADRMRKMLGNVFQVEAVYEKYFAPWNALNWKGYLLCSLKILLSYAGVHGSGENIVFCARKSVAS